MSTAGMSLVAKPTDDEIKRLAAEYPLVEARGGGADELSRATGVPLDVVQAALSDRQIAARLLDAHTVAEEDGRLLRPVAARVASAMLRRLEEAIEAGEVDIDDVANLLPKVHRVVEHADRIEAAKGDGYDNLPVFNITFVNGGIQVEPPKPASAAEVIDITPSEGTA